MFLGYNTNGLAHHRLEDALRLLAEMGYRGVAITLDHGVLNPFDDDLTAQLSRVDALLQKHQLQCVIETGARFLLDPRRKHEPTLVSHSAEERRQHVDFLQRAILIAERLGSASVSVWSGVLHDATTEEIAWSRLLLGLAKVLDFAELHCVSVGFEPEPGMFVDTMARYDELCERCPHPQLKLTLDIGHLQCQQELPIEAVVRRYGDQLVNVHLEDMRTGIHEHLMFGEGEIDFGPIIVSLQQVGYVGGAFVELSRHSHDGVNAARRSFAFLRPLIDS